MKFTPQEIELAAKHGVNAESLERLVRQHGAYAFDSVVVNWRPEPMGDEARAAIVKAHAALFAIDLLLAQTYTPDAPTLEALHEDLYQARRELERLVQPEAPRS